MLRRARGVGPAGRATPRAARRHRGAGRVLRALAGPAARPRLRNRRRGDQGRHARRSRAAGDHLEVSAVGHRLQVSRAAGDDPSQRHRAAGGTDRRGDAGGGARAGVAGRVDHRQCHAAQRRRDRAQGHPAGRPGGHRKGRRRHPEGRRASSTRIAPTGPSRGRCRRPVPSARARWCGPRARSSGAARTRPVRRSCGAASSTSRRATR